MTAPRMSLIIPAWNEQAYLPRLLDTVDAARACYHGGPDAVEVIVADNDSTDRTAEIARERGRHVAYVVEKSPAHDPARRRRVDQRLDTGVAEHRSRGISTTSALATRGLAVDEGAFTGCQCHGHSRGAEEPVQGAGNPAVCLGSGDEGDRNAPLIAGRE